MAQPSKYYNSSNTKKIEEEYGLKIDDLMNEDDDDDDDGSDAGMEGLEGFYKSAGIQKPSQSQQNSMLNPNKEPQDGKSFLDSAAQSLAKINPGGYKGNILDNLLSDSDDDENDSALYKLLQGNAPVSQLAKKNKDSEMSGDSNTTNEKSINDRVDTSEGEIKPMLTIGGTLQGKQSSKEQIKQQYNHDALDAVEKNEKINEINPDQPIDQAAQLLSFDNKFYNVQKKLMVYQEYAVIAKKLHFQKDHQFSGVVSCIAMYQNYLFVGNSSGIIRVFDLQTQKEMKPLMDSSLGQNKVTCIEIAEDGAFLISGYKKGQIALWDLLKYRLLKVIQECHTSDITHAKIYLMDESETIYAVSAEDTGAVCQLEFGKKGFLGGFTQQSQFLFKSRLKGTATIAVQRSSLVAFGSLNEIVVTSMRPIKEVFQVNKPSFCKEKSLPYIDWGYGLTPSKRDKTVPIMAFAWDRLIQLIYINEASSTIEMDGFYYSDSEIQSLFFMADSVLLALVNGREVKILYTTKFYPGHFKFLENAKREDIINNQFEKVITLTANSELERGHEVLDIRSQILQCQSVMNFNQCVKKYKNNIYFMGNKTVIKGRLFTWKEYIDHIKFKENYDWLTVLKIALEIYNGDLKGYAKVPDEKEVRSKQLDQYMKDIIKDSVQQVIYKYKNPSDNSADKVKEELKVDKSKQTTNNKTKGIELSLPNDRYQADTIAIKVSIEFCLNIQSTKFLFTEIYQIFVDNGLEIKFIQNLEPFILGGQFRKEKIPEKIIFKIINYYEKQGNFKTLEKVIQQLDFSEYKKKDELSVTCQHYTMISALLYLMTSHQEEELGCMQVLITMFKLMREGQNKDFTKEDILKLHQYEQVKKYQIEKTKLYIGYKLLWIIKMFLEGKMFPYGNLSMDKWTVHCYDICQFITNDDFLEDLLKFDSDQFFKITAKLFSGQPYKFFCTQKEFYNKLGAKGFSECMSLPQILSVFQNKCQKEDTAIYNFHRFIIQIQAAHLNDKNDDPPFKIEYDLVFQALRNELEKGGAILEEDIIINCIKAKKLNKEDIDVLLNIIINNKLTQSMPYLRIFLVEKKKDFVQSFKLHLAHNLLRKTIFDWINTKLDNLMAKGNSLQPFNQLKKAVHDQIKELIAIDVNQAIQIVNKWFEDSFQDTLILDELKDYPEIQFNYLKNFLAANEDHIQKIINESHYQKEKQAEAAKFNQYLILHTQLLCQYAQNDVENFVKKDYYPILECLKICQEKEIDKGIAVLLERSGEYIASINTYLSIIIKLDSSDMLKELKKLAGDNTVQISLPKWEFGQIQKQQKILFEFDSLIENAVRIATERNVEIVEDGWFTILEFLGEFVKIVNQRIEKGATRSEKNQQERFKDFILKRKNAILKLIPTSISLKTIMDRLNLDFGEIKKLYDFKIKAIQNDEKYLKLAKSILIYELNDISALLRYLNDKGFMMKDEERCQACEVQLNMSIQKQPYTMFSCGHSFHVNCLKKDKKCPLCVKQSIEIASKQEMRKKMKEEDKDEKQSSSLDKSMSFLQGSSSVVDKSNSSKSQGLYLKQLEVFDSTLDSQSMSSSSFYS